MDERYNHQCLHKPLGAELPYFCHYQYPRVIRHEAAAVALVQSIDEQYPEIAEIRKRSPEWAQIGATHRLPRKLPPATPRPDLVITGIPHSGATELTARLNQVDDCAVFERMGKLPLILSGVVVHRVFTFYQGRRVQLQDRAVGVATSDLLILDDEEVRVFKREVSRSDFALGTTNELGYMTRLNALRVQLPHARLVACVRDPFETIAEWKSDPAFANADLASWELGSLSDPWLSGEQRRKLELVAALPTAAMRRAALWCYFADTVIEQAVLGLQVVRWDDLHARPSEVVGKLLEGWDLAIPRLDPAPTQSKARAVLDHDDVVAIRAACSRTATQLGVYDPMPFSP
jgi:hypothetical protein